MGGEEAGGYNSVKTILSILAAVMLAGTCWAWDTIRLDVPAGAKEAGWRDALADLWHGQTEVVIPFGRIDVMTDNYVVEIDFLHKWTECFGQALFYSYSTGQQGICALIVENPAAVKDKLMMIEKLLNKYDLGLIVLTSK